MKQLVFSLFFAVCFGMVFPSVAWALVTQADIMTELPEKVFSQCGIVSGTFAFFAFLFAGQSAKRQKAWDEDRAGMMRLIFAQDERDLKVTETISEVKGMLLAVRNKR